MTLLTLLEDSQWRLKSKLESVKLPPSCCGLIGAYSVCEALEIPYSMTVDHLKYINQRAHNMGVGSYLSSRSCAGMTAATLAGLTKDVSDGRIHSRFFPTRGASPEALKNLLSAWLTEKAVLVLTLNPQMMDPDESSSEEHSDAWHHHPVSGLEENGQFRMIYPEASYAVEQLHRMVDCESALLIRAQDIVYQTLPKGTVQNSRSSRKTDDLEILKKQSDARWNDLTVHDTVKVLLDDSENHLHDIEVLKQRQRIKIPAAYEPGVTIFVDQAESMTRQKLDDFPALTGI